MIDPHVNWRERTVVVLGGGGFIGRYVCEQLFATGVRVRVAQRHPRQAYFLQPLAAVGQLDIVPVDMTRPDTLGPVIEGAWGVINLVGAFDGNLLRVHAEAPARAAELAAQGGAGSFVHVSAIGADPASPSIYSSTKGEGERRVREAFPSATIIRPSLVFGQEDQLTNRFAGMAKRAFLPVLAPGTRFQPVWAGDLARAIATAATDPEDYAGKTFEIGGPQVMTMRELNREIAELAGQEPEIVDLPDFVGDLMSRAGFLPGAPLTRDQWLMLQKDNVASGPGLEAFGIEPTPLGTIGQDWLGRFRKGGRFASRNAQASAG